MFLVVNNSGLKGLIQIQNPIKHVTISQSLQVNHGQSMIINGQGNEVAIMEESIITPAPPD